MMRFKRTLAVGLALMLTVTLCKDSVVNAAETGDIETTENDTEAVAEEIVEAEEVTDASMILVDKSTFPDDALRNFILSEYEIGEDNLVSVDEVTNIYMGKEDGIVHDAKGIELLTELEWLAFDYCDFATIDLSANTKLTSLELEGNSVIHNIDISKNKKLNQLWLECPNMEMPDISNQNLIGMYLDIKPMESLSLAGGSFWHLMIVSPVNNLDLSNMETDYDGYYSVNAIDSINVKGVKDNIIIEGGIKHIELDNEVRRLTLHDASRLSEEEYTKLNQLYGLELYKYKYDYKLNTFDNLELFACDKNVDISECYRLKTLGIRPNGDDKIVIPDIKVRMGQDVSLDFDYNFLWYSGEEDDWNATFKVQDESIVEVENGYYNIINALKEGNTAVNYRIVSDYDGTVSSGTFNITVGPAVIDTFGDVTLTVKKATNLICVKTIVDGVKNIKKYSYYYEISNDNGSTWSDALNYEWEEKIGVDEINIVSEYYGNLLIRVTVEEIATGEKKQATVSQEYHPYIKGNCQLPYGMIVPGEPGYLIGLETYSYDYNVDSVEMLILDCTSMQWVYSTGKCPVPENMLWTVWQPQYGYYWTLFRVYDEDGKLIDEVCYGFANI